MKSVNPKLAGTINKLGVHDHASLIYSTVREQLSVTVPYIKAGLLQGEQCIYIASELGRENLLKRLQKVSIDTRAMQNDGRLVLLGPEQVYLHDGKFDALRIKDSFTQTMDIAKSAGFNVLRVSGEAGWLKECDYENMIAYETMIDDIFDKYDVSALCQYRKNDFPSSFIKDIMLTHPYVIFDNYRRFFKTNI